MSKKDELETEKKTIRAMVEIYCASKHNTENKKLCGDCGELLEYALVRLDKCPFGADKGPCSHCEVHCYKQDMRDKVRDVMRFSGPRMLKKHPVLAVKHLMKTKRADKKQNSSGKSSDQQQ
jgi:hypothetical protein